MIGGEVEGSKWREFRVRDLEDTLTWRRDNES